MSGRRKEERFAQLLRWYPRAWRDENGAVLLGTMLDAADAQGRRKPGFEDRYFAMLHGLGQRLDLKMALRSGVAALLLAIAMGATAMWGSIVLAEAGLYWIVTLIGTGICPALVFAALMALARQRGTVSGARAVVALALVFTALACATAARHGFSLGFDAADAGTGEPLLARAVGILFLMAWVSGVAATALMAAGVMNGRQSWRHTIVLLLIGMLGSLVVGFLLMIQYTSAIGAVLVTLAAAAQSQRAAKGVPTSNSIVQNNPAALSDTTASPALSAAPAPMRVSPGRSSGAQRILAWVAAAGGVAGVVYALTGSAWSNGASDGTVAMGQGITLGLAAGVPFLAALGLRLRHSWRRSPVQLWGPLGLTVLALAAIAGAYLHAPAWEGMAGGFLLASVFGGMALAWILFPHLPGSTSLRVLLAALIGAVVAAFMGMLIAPLIVFMLPVAAVALALWRDSGGGTRGAAIPAAVM